MKKFLSILAFALRFVRFLWERRRLLAGAQVVVYGWNRGFGHTITTPDAARRYYRGQKVVALMLATESRHNRHVTEIWPDIDVLFFWIDHVPDGLPHDFYPESLVAEAWGDRILRGFLRLLSPRVEYVNDLYERVSQKKIHGQTSTQGFNDAYFDLIRGQDAPLLAFRGQRRESILSQLAPLRDEAAYPFSCCVYLRGKGSGSDDVTSQLRDGNDPAELLETYRMLNRRGYQVWMVGDKLLPDGLKKSLGRGFIDYRDTGLEKGVFSLHAAMECSISLLDSGGGAWLATANRIPTLLINAFPIGHTMPDALILYKWVKDANRRDVPFAELSTRHFMSYRMEKEGLSIELNTGDDILAAASELVDAHRDSAPVKPARGGDDCPWLESCGAHLARVYRERTTSFR